MGGVLVAEGDAAEADLERIAAEEKTQIEEAIRFAEESPAPAAEELWRDVYAEADAGEGGRHG